MKRITASVFFLPTILIISFLLGVGLTFIFLPKGIQTGSFELRSTQDNLAFTSPLLECVGTNNPLPKEARASEEALRTYIATKKADGTLTDIGVYYRDLNNGPSFGIDATNEFSPGSLLKVPLLLALYKEKERNAVYFDQTVEYIGGSSRAAQDIPVGHPITTGHTYTVQELVRNMIVESDNNATLLLYQLLGYQKTAETYFELGLAPPRVDIDYKVSVRDYATFLRLLFNATYLSKVNSNEALELLSQSDFKDGLVAGVPAGIVVSHKFGERRFEGDLSVDQLHDCGVVYKPNHPYVLCIMTRGHNAKTLALVIAQMSKIVYSHAGT